MTSTQVALTLRLLVDAVELVVENSGPGPLRVWDRENSWGWRSLELEVSPDADGDWIRLVPRERIWTRNLPVAVEIAPGGRHSFVVRGGSDSEWDAVERVRHLRDERMRVRGSLRIPPSAEAEEHRVFVGEVTSPVYVSDPPHGWL